jgi:hypothetical protein
MDHELVPRPSEACDWMLNSSREQIGLHQAKNVREPIDIEVPKRQNQNPILSTDMVQRLFRWEGQKRWSGKNSQGPMAEKCQKKLIFFYLPRRSCCKLLLKQTNGLISCLIEKAVLGRICHFFLQQILIV